MLTYATNLQLALDVVGVFVFAISGALVAVRKRLDLFGVLVLAAIAGLGGGVIRDLLLGVHPPVGVSDWRLLAATAAGGLVTFRFHPSIERITRFVRILDAAGLAAFAISGTLKALGLGVEGIAAIIIGGVTAIGGGVLRDVLAGQVPEVLRRELYAIPALLGSGLLVLAFELDVMSSLVVWGCVALVFIMRMAAVLLDLNAPTAFRSSESKKIREGSSS